MDLKYRAAGDAVVAADTGAGMDFSSLPVEIRRWRLSADDPGWAQGVWLALAVLLYPMGYLVAQGYAFVMLALLFAMMMASFLLPVVHWQHVRIDRHRIGVVGGGMFEQRAMMPVNALARVVWGSREPDGEPRPVEEHIVHLEHEGAPGWAVVLYAGRRWRVAYAWWWGMARLLDLEQARIEVGAQDARFDACFLKYDEARFAAERVR